jgi:glycerophosphoryl diester phosphodiesterase
MIELDVQLTRDRRPVVFHDDRLERTTDGSGRVARTAFARLSRLDAGSWFHPRFAGERILSVAQAVALIPPPAGINLELKRTSAGAILGRSLLRLLDRPGIRRRLLLSSFEPALLRPFMPHRIALALICREGAERSLALAVRLGCLAWHPFHTLVTPRRVAQAHAAGLRVHAWTVDDLRLARRLVRWGVDGLFTNHPARLKALHSTRT